MSGAEFLVYVCTQTHVGWITIAFCVWLFIADYLIKKMW